MDEGLLSIISVSCGKMYVLRNNRRLVKVLFKEHLAIRRIFSLVDMITNTKFSNCPDVFEIGVVKQ